MTEAAEWKIQRVATLKDLVLSAPLVGVASIDGIPAPQMQKMRAQLRGRASMVVSKNNLIALALKEASGKLKKVDGLADLMSGQTALILGSGNPFALFKVLEDAKVKAPARGGEIAPEDIVVRRGDTPFKPGPVVGDLQRVGLPAAIEGGKVVIKKDHLLVKKGAKISRHVAQVLTKLEIHPLTVGPRLQGSYEGGTIYPREVLAVDTDAILADFSLGASRAFHLAVEVAYPTPETVRPLLTKAHLQALHLAIEAGIPTRETLPMLLQMAQARMLTLASHVPEALDEELRALVSAAPAKEPEDEEPEEEEKPKEEEASEEEVAEGLSSLFG
jgi:large subunit ribosomal protein L10